MGICTACHEDKKILPDKTACTACRNEQYREKRTKREEERKADDEMWRKVITRRLEEFTGWSPFKVTAPKETA